MEDDGGVMKILISYAIPAERVRIEFFGCQVRYCETGIGKVNAALAVCEAVRDAQLDLVLNVGTAGSVTHAVGSIVACGRFIDRDMMQLKEFGVPYTGDTFVTQVIEQADVVDMENFAVAEVCRRAGIPLVSVKYITDRIGENSVQHWEEKLHEANIGLQAFFDGWSANWE